MLDKLKGLAHTAAEQVAGQTGRRYRYQVTSLDTIESLAAEIEMMAGDGWEPVLAYQETTDAHRHVVVYRMIEATASDEQQDGATQADQPSAAPAPPRCGKCNGQLSEAAKYCGSCGAPVEGATH